jgi:hypothetical protein
MNRKQRRKPKFVPSKQPANRKVGRLAAIAFGALLVTFVGAAAAPMIATMLPASPATPQRVSAPARPLALPPLTSRSMMLQGLPLNLGPAAPSLMEFGPNVPNRTPTAP